MHPVLAIALVASLQSPDSGATLYRAWCSACHGTDGRGVSAKSTRLEVPAPDLAACATSSAETEDQWTGIVTKGGAAYGLALDMPAYGGGASPEQIHAIVRYIRSLCRERGWPPGELNFPRAFLAEKAYPENEWVIANAGADQALVYERRVGRRLQLEVEARRPVDGTSAAVKYNLWHDLDRRALASVALEVAPPLGRAERWEVEPFVAFGANPGRVWFLQGEVSVAWEEAAGVAEVSYSGGVGREVGRFVPMIEAQWTVPMAADRTLSFYPQVWVRLSRLGHVAGSLGIELPAVGPEPRHPKLIAFLLWDYGDGSLVRGW